MSHVEDAEIIPEITSLVRADGSELNPEKPYAGMASGMFSPEQVAILMATPHDDDIEIRPDGLIYLPGMYFRMRLNDAFGPGAWGMLPFAEEVNEANGHLYYHGALIIQGRFVARAVGETDYREGGKYASYATAVESAKTNCLVRCCKDLGIAAELWLPRFVRRWKAEYAVEAWITNQHTKKRERRWRRSDESFSWPYEEDDRTSGVKAQQERRAQERDESFETRSERRENDAERAGEATGSTQAQPAQEAAPARRTIAGMPARPWKPELVRELIRNSRAMRADDAEERVIDKETFADFRMLVRNLFGNDRLTIRAMWLYLFDVDPGHRGGVTRGQMNAIEGWAHLDIAHAQTEAKLLLGEVRAMIDELHHQEDANELANT